MASSEELRVAGCAALLPQRPPKFGVGFEEAEVLSFVSASFVEKGSEESRLFGEEWKSRGGGCVKVSRSRALLAQSIP
jgi:hypothetical protein